MTQPDASQTPDVDPNLDRAKVVAQKIKDALEAGGVQLGTAKTQSGLVLPAIVVGDWEKGTLVTGLEVLIPLSPKLEAPIGFAFLGFSRTWVIYLINRGAKPDMLEKASNAIAERFYPFDFGPDIQEASPETYERVRIGINADQLLDD